MGLIVGLDLLLQHLTLLTLAKLLTRQVFNLLLTLQSMSLRLLRQLLAVTPCLHLPDQRADQQHQQQRWQAPQHSTSRARAQSFRRSSRPLSPPLM